MKIAVVGAGYVGLVTASCFADLGHRVTSIDNDRRKIALLKKGKPHFYEPGLEELVKKNVKAGRLSFVSETEAGVRDAEVVFIAVGTPPRDNGDADLSQVESVANAVAKTIKSYKLIVEKSTVPVQTGQRIRDAISRAVGKKAPFDVVSNPEFLREGSAIRDFLYPDRIVIGTDSAKARKVLKEVYKGVRGPMIFTDVNSAEIIKHASNSFLAMKISFINAIARICELAGADVVEVAEGIGLDKRIGRSFLNAGIGFGGFCFPKDIAAFVRISEKLGYDFELMKAVEKVNADQRRFFLKKIEDALWNVSGKKIAVWGLSFKPDTDDMRFAPSIDILSALALEGAHIKAYDPKAMEKARAALPARVSYAKSALDAARGADCLVILTEWEEFRKANLKRLKSAMASPLVIDGRNLFEPASMAKAGFQYLSIGRKPRK